MGDGTLPREAFKNYMIQDYLYLVYMAMPTCFTASADTHTDPICSGQCAGKLQIHISR
jgi:thiaminase